MPGASPIRLWCRTMMSVNYLKKWAQLLLTRSICRKTTAPRPVYLGQLPKTPFFRPPGKNDLANDPLQGRSLLKQANPRKNQTRFKGPWWPSFFKPNSAVFWQTGGDSGTYFHIPEPDCFRGGFRTGTRQSEPKLGVFSLMFSTPGYQTSPRRDRREMSHTPTAPHLINFI